jgi:hypothetical protein
MQWPRSLSRSSLAASWDGESAQTGMSENKHGHQALRTAGPAAEESARTWRTYSSTYSIEHHNRARSLQGPKTSTRCIGTHRGIDADTIAYTVPCPRCPQDELVPLTLTLECHPEALIATEVEHRIKILGPYRREASVVVCGDAARESDGVTAVWAAAGQCIQPA